MSLTTNKVATLLFGSRFPTGIVRTLYLKQQPQSQGLAFLGSQAGPSNPSVSPEAVRLSVTSSAVSAAGLSAVSGLCLHGFAFSTRPDPWHVWRHGMETWRNVDFLVGPVGLILATEFQGWGVAGLVVVCIGWCIG